ncbi:FKBP-type peptidyl-prolyl cis-trans isomerase [Parasediminibacterium paludis]|uniref:Peptidyl-prolyl cis-trans isomerase n=1 Tax=Parasediminibacterium paludis TaxID=908966 RepID=A0ABV8PZF7_9BACT
MKKVAIILTFTAAAISVTAQVKKPAAKPTATTAKPLAVVNPLKNSTDSASYALGARIAQNIKSQGFEGINQVVFQKAINDVLKGNKLAIVEEGLDACIGTYQQKAQSAKSAVAKAAGKKFLDANGKRPGVVTLPSGLQYEVVKAGTDTTKPKMGDKVKCHYHGTLIDGKVFDSSVDRGEPIVFPVAGVIKGWTEALQLMTVGSKWKLYIPSELAYGDQQAGPSIAPGSTLIFDVELISIEK